MNLFVSCVAAHMLVRPDFLKERVRHSLLRCKSFLMVVTNNEQHAQRNIIHITALTKTHTVHT